MSACTHEDFENGESNKKLMGQRAETHIRMLLLFLELFHNMKVDQGHSFKATHGLQSSGKSQYTLVRLAT